MNSRFLMMGMVYAAPESVENKAFGQHYRDGERCRRLEALKNCIIDTVDNKHGEETLIEPGKVHFYVNCCSIKDFTFYFIKQLGKDYFQRYLLHHIFHLN